MDIDTVNAIAFVLFWGGIVGGGVIWSLLAERAPPVRVIDPLRPLPGNPALAYPPMIAVGEAIQGEVFLGAGAITWVDAGYGERPGDLPPSENCGCDRCMEVFHPEQLLERRTKHQEAESRSFALFRSWLSPEQLAQFERESAIDVTGCDTGSTYRIQKGRSQNVYQFMPNGNVAQWCFVPEGNLATGDVMLAQKIALETMETKAMKVANRVPSYVGLPMPMYQP